MASPLPVAESDAAQPWRLPALVKASGLLHLGAAASVIAMPTLWPWALGAVLVDHAVITATGLWPRSTWLGQNLGRLPPAAASRREIALTIDDGPDPAVTPRVLDLLDAAGARATFFCIADRAAQHPALCRQIAQRGHSVQNHSQHHSHTFSLLGPSAMGREIDRAQDTIAQITGERPRFFRAPAGLRNPFLAPLLHRRGLLLASWTRRGFDTRRGDPAEVLSRLSRDLAAGDILLLHDGHAARTSEGQPVVLAVLPALLQRIAAEGLRCVTLNAALQAQTESRPARRRGDDDAGLCMSPALASRRAWPELLDAASAPYRCAGLFAWRFARGKLRMDPVFHHLLHSGLIPHGAQVLDIGCGQGLLASLLRACETLQRSDRWPSSWAPAPLGTRVTGIELMHRDVQRARTALGDAADFVCGDMRSTPFPAADAVVILDVLHYISVPEQNQVLARVRAALPEGGRLLLRVGDASLRPRFLTSQWIDAVVTLARGHRVLPQFGRPLADWTSQLEQLGFVVRAQWMSQGTPFANVLLVAQVASPPTCGPARDAAPASSVTIT